MTDRRISKVAESLVWRELCLQTMRPDRKSWHKTIRRNIRNNFRLWIISVSYTHLDVYKRQSLLIVAPPEFIMIPIKVLKSIFRFREKSTLGLSVSYTHLDVYKRQPSDFLSMPVNHRCFSWNKIPRTIKQHILLLQRLSLIHIWYPEYIETRETLMEHAGTTP